MLPLIAAVFLASLIGSIHCVGMCGPLAILAGSTHGASQRRWGTITAYHAGRVVSYGLAGALVGWMGAGIEWTGDWVGAQQLAAKLAGGSMLVVGLLSLVRLIGGTRHHTWMPAWFQRHLAVAHAWARRQPPLRRAAAIGVLTSILPCGWLYAFLLVAAGTASVAGGMVVMVFFALGSVPALSGLVFSTTLLLGRFQKIIPWCSALLVIGVGAYTLGQRSQTDVSKLDRLSKVSNLSSLVRHVKAIDQEELPCCAPKEVDPE